MLDDHEEILLLVIFKLLLLMFQCVSLFVLQFLCGLE